MRCRFAGRFITQDPMGFAAGDANTYRYVFNSPTNGIDPTGKEWVWPWQEGAQWSIYPSNWAIGEAGADIVSGVVNSPIYVGLNDGAEIALDWLTLNIVHNQIAYLTEQRQQFWNDYPGWVTWGTTGLAGLGTGLFVTAGGMLIWGAVGPTVTGWLYGVGGVGGAACSRIPNCFPPETLVGTESGLRPIGEIEAGDKVWAFDFHSGTWRLCAVECRHDSTYDGALVTIDVGVGEVTSTAYHPFWVIEGEDLENRPPLRHVELNEDRNRFLPGRWVNSHDLRNGDVVFLRGRGTTSVKRIWRRHEHTSVCNLTMKGLHTFAVGDIEALVHNTSGTTPDFVPGTPSPPQWAVGTTGQIVQALNKLQAQFDALLRAYDATDDVNLAIDAQLQIWRAELAAIIAELAKH